jgi:UDP-N-acetylglucosamine 2-epimerase (non-hydrolysing)
MPIKVLCVIGTRPEAIKMAPVILALKSQSWAEVRVLATAQHRDMLDQINQFFNIVPDIDLDLMRPNQSLAALTGNLLLKVDAVLASERPDVVLVQGDTTTVMTVALASFYRDIPIGHIEAGLRTLNMRNPFPEELNRIFVAKLAKWHFSPTEASKLNLLKEGVLDANIKVVGNTVIDSLLIASSKNIKLTIPIDPSKRLILVTIHRRESFGKTFERICQALLILAKRNKDVQFVYPVHPNPNVKDLAHKILGNLSNFILCDPLSYSEFIELMKKSYIILTDSGGVQEEAPALGKPVLVLRQKTERPEAIELGVVRLIGVSGIRIIRETQRLLDDKISYLAMSKKILPYGEGQASEQIVSELKSHFVD